MIYIVVEGSIVKSMASLKAEKAIEKGVGSQTQSGLSGHQQKKEPTKPSGTTPKAPSSKSAAPRKSNPKKKVTF